MMEGVPTKQQILQRFKDGLDLAVDRGQDELLQQGHRATSNLIRSLEPKVVKDTLDLLIGQILMLDYGEKVDTGTPASQVPKPTDGARYRQYILNLLDWTFVIEPSIPMNERYRWVRGTARAHAREGIPTKASVRFSKNGRRTGWIMHAFETKEAQADFEAVFDLGDLFELAFFNALEALNNPIP